jgi:hypothetical protein
LDILWQEFMNPSEIIATQVQIPKAVYELIEQRAQAKGHSFDDEISSLLSASVALNINELEDEFALWEAASDEDDFNFEAMLAVEEA